MPHFQMEGADAPEFQKLDAFTRGYIEALFFTEFDSLDEQALEDYIADGGEDSFKGPCWGFSSLAPETLAAIVADCAKFQADNARDIDQTASKVASGAYRWRGPCVYASAGHDFWLTRNAYGSGFWDGDWPEDVGERLTTASKQFGEIDAYLGDDGRVYLS